MTETSTLHPTTSVSTFGLQVAYRLDMLEAGLSEYGIRTAPRHYLAERQEPLTTQPVSRGVYFAKVPQHPVIECYYFRGHGDFAAPAVPVATHPRGINSSLRDVTAMLFFAAANARVAGETTRPLIRPEHHKAGGGKGHPTRTWIAQEENDIGGVILTLHAIHRRSVLTALIARASELGKLKKGWNSYSAQAPTPAAIGNAKTLLTLASVAGIIPERIEPSAMGGVGVTFTAGSREVAVEFYNAGTAHALFSDNETGALDTAPVAPGVEGYSRLLQKVGRYLYGHNTTTPAPRPKLLRRSGWSRFLRSWCKQLCKRRKGLL
jgi:hypothetical protein